MNYVANEIVTLTPNSLEFRTVRAFVDGYGHLVGDSDFETKRKEWQATIRHTTAEIADSFQNPEAIVQFIASTLARVEETKLNRNASSHVLLYELLAGTNSLAQYVVEYALGATHCN